MMKQRYLGVMLMTVSFLCGNAAVAAQPNFIFIQGEAQGWASMSVQLDPDHPDSQSRGSLTPTRGPQADAGTTGVGRDAVLILLRAVAAVYAFSCGICNGQEPGSVTHDIHVQSRLGRATG